MTSLFLLYVNDLCNVSTRLTSILFADDTSCFIEDIDLSDIRIQLSTEMNKLDSKLSWSDHVSYTYVTTCRRICR